LRRAWEPRLRDYVVASKTKPQILWTGKEVEETHFAGWRTETEEGVSIPERQREEITKDGGVICLMEIPCREMMYEQISRKEFKVGFNCKQFLQ
jgi:hypothetical protein